MAAGPNRSSTSNHNEDVRVRLAHNDMDNCMTRRQIFYRMTDCMGGEATPTMVMDSNWHPTIAILHFTAEFIVFATFCYNLFNCVGKTPSRRVNVTKSLDFMDFCCVILH